MSNNINTGAGKIANDEQKAYEKSLSNIIAGIALQVYTEKYNVSTKQVDVSKFNFVKMEGVNVKADIFYGIELLCVATINEDGSIEIETIK